MFAAQLVYLVLKASVVGSIKNVALRMYLVASETRRRGVRGIETYNRYSAAEYVYAEHEVELLPVYF